MDKAITLKNDEVKLIQALFQLCPSHHQWACVNPPPSSKHVANCPYKTTFENSDNWVLPLQLFFKCDGGTMILFLKCPREDCTRELEMPLQGAANDQKKFISGVSGVLRAMDKGTNEFEGAINSIWNKIHSQVNLFRAIAPAPSTLTGPANFVTSTGPSTGPSVGPPNSCTLELTPETVDAFLNNPNLNLQGKGSICFATNQVPTKDKITATRDVQELEELLRQGWPLKNETFSSHATLIYDIRTLVKQSQSPVTFCGLKRTELKITKTQTNWDCEHGHYLLLLRLVKRISYRNGIQRTMMPPASENP